MSPSFSCVLVLLISLLISYSNALRFTSGSHCASLCLDSADSGGASDLNSSIVANEDIICYDSQYTASPAGPRSQRCMRCLQESTFYRGSESDQLWFLYNLRYTFNNCIFGLVNASEISFSPCSASSACGPLEPAFAEINQLDYSYCDTDGGVLSSSSVSKCETCIGAFGDQGFLVNSLVALEAGCNQRPAPGSRIGLNDTVFSPTRISTTDPITKESHPLPPTTIVGIVLGGLAAILLFTGLLFIYGRKRRNRRIQLEGDPRPSSPLSFCCQTRLPPCSPAFIPSQYAAALQEKSHSQIHPALRPHTAGPELPPSRTSPAARQYQSSTMPCFSPPRITPLPLPPLSTGAPAVPDNVHYSTSPKSAQFSPHDVTPNSATSTGHLLGEQHGLYAERAHTSADPVPPRWAESKRFGMGFPDPRARWGRGWI
ncbi:hypothetical protein GGS21DRAFT_495900 [Xylaria nigripes]|nr:hypothetical protein GGS21DRAFT_495900 [Xylaria nigripes]